MSNQETKKMKQASAVIVVVLLLIVAVIAYFLTAEMRTYFRAGKLAEDGAYEEAIAVYETVSDYQDAPVRIRECRYQIALGLEKTGDYAGAKVVFEELGDYSDAADRVNECAYQLASELEKSGGYAQAKAAFEALGTYSESEAHVNECAYQLAAAAEGEGRYEDARAAFEALGSYSDAESRADGCAYHLAVNLQETGEFAEAQTAFEALGNYSDAAVRAKACGYEIAAKLEEEGKYEEARIAFAELGSYSDAADRVNACGYHLAEVLEQTGSAPEALTAFAALGEYADSADRASAIQTAMDEYAANRTAAEQQRQALLDALTAAETLLDEGGEPLDESARTELQTLVDSVTAEELPEIPTTFADYRETSSALSGMDFEEKTRKADAAREALEKSIRQCTWVTAPSEAYVIDRLMRVPSVACIAAVTEDSDPNGNLGKEGGYTAQVYFSSPLVNEDYALISKAELMEMGTNAGGSIEVYAAKDDALNREHYLAAFDGTVKDTGSHRVIGTVVVRTSSSLKASEQAALEAELVEALTAAEPMPIIEKQREAELPPLTAEPKEESRELPLVSIKEMGYQMSSGSLYYGVILRNNSKDKIIEFPEICITARDADGKLLASETQVFMTMYPNQDIAWASVGGVMNEMPAKVEVEVAQTEAEYLHDLSEAAHPQYIPLEIRGAKLIRGLISEIKGGVYNPNDFDVNETMITVLYRDADGKLLAGETGFCSKIEAGSTAPFEIHVREELVGASFEVYASPW